jgi:DNA-binding NarL/FixJ family response regulator
MDRREWSYVFSPESDHAGLERNELPSFWTSSLSKSFGKSAGVSAKPRTGKRLSIEERREKCCELRAKGWSLSQIARELHVSKGTVVNDLKDAA